MNQTKMLDLTKKSRPAETVIQALLFFAGILSIFVTVMIVYELGKEAMLFFNDPDVTFGKFFGGTKWQPGIGQYGIWALVSATLTTSAIAMLIALPFMADSLQGHMMRISARIVSGG